MEIKKTKYDLELTREEIEMLVQALRCECEYRGERISELDTNKYDDIVKRDNLIEQYEPYRELLGQLGEVIGVHFSGKDY